MKKILPKDSIAALECCDKNGLPIIHTLLEILQTQAISMALLKSPFSFYSVYKPVKSSIEQERLTG